MSSTSNDLTLARKLQIEEFEPSYKKMIENFIPRQLANHSHNIVSKTDPRCQGILKYCHESKAIMVESLKKAMSGDNFDSFEQISKMSKLICIEQLFDILNRYFADYFNLCADFLSSISLGQDTRKITNQKESLIEEILKELKLFEFDNVDINALRSLLEELTNIFLANSSFRDAFNYVFSIIVTTNLVNEHHVDAAIRFVNDSISNPHPDEGENDTDQDIDDLYSDSEDDHSIIPLGGILITMNKEEVKAKNKALIKALKESREIHSRSRNTLPHQSIEERNLSQVRPTERMNNCSSDSQSDEQINNDANNRQSPRKF